MQLEETWEYKGQVGFETTAGQITATVQEVKDYCENDGIHLLDFAGGEIYPTFSIDQYFEDNFDKCAEYYFYNVIQK